MTTNQYAHHPIRLQRSVLSVPGVNPHMFEKAFNSDADYVLLDCEDSVPADDKDVARNNVIQAVQDLDWRRSGKTVLVRINPPDSQFMYRDIVEIFESAGELIDCVLVPKANNRSDIYMVERLLSQIATAKGFDNHCGIEAMIETATGMLNIAEIATASNRLEALHFGAGDFAASCRARTVAIGGLNPDYPGDQWNYAMQRIAVTCRANGLRPIDSAYGDFKDTDGFIAAAKRAAALGFEGKWAIHPSQISLANEVMTPPPEEVRNAREILDALEAAEKKGKGAAQLNGVMIDVASIRMAENIVALDELISTKQRS